MNPVTDLTARARSGTSDHRRDPEIVSCSWPAPHVLRLAVEPGGVDPVPVLAALDTALQGAVRHPGVHVVVVALTGHRACGHGGRGEADHDTSSNEDVLGPWRGHTCEGAESIMAHEQADVFERCERWRNLPKPTIAEVRGEITAGALMTAWSCDLIVASEDATFLDNSVAMGVCGTEVLRHPWELGSRKAKELLFTGRPISSCEARALGMINHVVPGDELAEFTTELAERISAMPQFALQLAKSAVNAAEDSQGRATALRTAFTAHQLSHSHNLQCHGVPVEPACLEPSSLKLGLQRWLDRPRRGRGR